MWTYNYNKNQNELRHHGILGQKWGHRNGPPYPLGSSDHSASERKAGSNKKKDNRKKYKKSVDKKIKKRHNRLNKKQKIAIGIVAGVVAGAALSAGTYVALRKTNSAPNLIDEIVLKRDLGFKKVKSITLGMNVPDKISESATKTALNVNRNNIGKPGQNMNCTECSLAYAVRQLGYDVYAKGNEVKGVKVLDIPIAIDKIFKNSVVLRNRKSAQYNGNALLFRRLFEDDIKKEYRLKNTRAFGTVHFTFGVNPGLQGKSSGHSMNWEYDPISGSVTIFDVQGGKERTLDKYIMALVSRNPDHSHGVIEKHSSSRLDTVTDIDWNEIEKFVE